MAKFTKKAIMDCFLNMLKRKNIDRVMVTDICEQCGINRNTFFYSYSIVGIVSRWIGEGMPPYDKDLIKRFSESFDATIDTMINLCEANN